MADTMSDRTLNYVLLTLPYARTMRVLLDLGLLEDSDRRRDFMDIVDQAMRRARERDLRGRLVESLIAALHAQKEQASHG